jgi:hypothetical protein
MDGLEFIGAALSPVTSTFNVFEKRSNVVHRYQEGILMSVCHWRTPQLGILNAELFIQAHAKLYPTKCCLVGYKSRW